MRAVAHLRLSKDEEARDWRSSQVQAEAIRLIQRGLARRKKPITISRELEAAGIRTPNGGRKWKASLVKRLAELPA